MPAVHSAAARVLVVGDANPDLVLTGDVVPRFGQSEQLLDHAVLTIGGSAAITAHGFARLGRPVSLVAAVGTDVFGDRICADLAKAGVAVGGVIRRAAEPTGLTVVLSDADDRTMLTLLGAIASLTATEVARAIADARTEGLCHVHVSSLFLLPKLATELPHLLAELRASGITTSLDTNDDPSGKWAGVDALLPHLDVFLPNRSELTAIARIDEPRKAAMALATQGPLVVTKLGADGAFASRASGEVVNRKDAALIPVDSSGAGDTFDAAFLDAWLSGLGLSECLRRAVRAGSLVVNARGGTPGQPTRNELLPDGAVHER